MEILKVNYKIGAKCYTRYQNAFRECIFLGTKGIKREEQTNYADSFYVLNIAGIGETLIQFDRAGQSGNWYRTTKCNTPLYPTLDDCMNKTNCITAMYGTTSNCYNAAFMRQFFPECSVCNCGGNIYAWAWNGTDAVKIICGLTSNEYLFDKDGFHRNGEVFAIARAGICSAFENFCKIYPSKEACMAENKAEIVTF